MGKLVHSYAKGPVIEHVLNGGFLKPVRLLEAVKPKQRRGGMKVTYVWTKVRISRDPSHLRYVVLDGCMRRRPETLPASRRRPLMQKAA